MSGVSPTPINARPIHGRATGWQPVARDGITVNTTMGHRVDCSPSLAASDDAHEVGVQRPVCVLGRAATLWVRVT